MQVPDTVEQAAAAAASQQAPAAVPKRSNAYDANSYTNYGQTAGAKDFQSTAAKYGGSAPAASHLGAAAVNMAGVSAGPTSGPAAAAVAAQTPISQVRLNNASSRNTVLARLQIDALSTCSVRASEQAQILRVLGFQLKSGVSGGDPHSMLASVCTALERSSLQNAIRETMHVQAGDLRCLARAPLRSAVQ